MIRLNELAISRRGRRLQPWALLVIGLLACGSTTANARTICEAAQDARARNSPAAPGLERQCAAQKPPVSLGKVKPPPVDLGKVKSEGAPPPQRTLCEAAADARARNSPAAAGLERQCRAAGGPPPVAPPPPVVQAPPADGVPADLVISGIYSGGPTGVLNYDFVELRNRGELTVPLSGWSVQYASSLGSSWQVMPLSGWLASGETYLLVSSGPVPNDVVANTTAPLQLAAASGKLALVRTTLPLRGACPEASDLLVDLVGYGTTNCFRGSGAAAAPGPALALQRAEDGCSDTRDNAIDFIAVGAEPRNRRIERAPCAVLAEAEPVPAEAEAVPAEIEAVPAEE